MAKKKEQCTALNVAFYWTGNHNSSSIDKSLNLVLFQEHLHSLKIVAMFL